MDTSLPLTSEEREVLCERKFAATEKYTLQKALGHRQELLEGVLRRLTA